MSTDLAARQASNSDDEIIGHLIGGRYRVTSLIGRGGMASVYRAVDQSLPRDVALKLMLPEMADPDEMHRHHNEIETLAALNHHALVTLFDAGTETTPSADRVFLVMEFVDGPNLREIMTAPLSLSLVAHVGADIAEALHYMHGRGIVHRDIKPANILLAPSELPDRKFHAKLADFGIARLVDGTRLTSTGLIIGSASFLSPEQALGGEIAGASDVYSLGLVLLEAITGERAFPGNAMETMSARLNRTPLLPESLDEHWRTLLENMTTIDAEHRPPPMEIAVALRALANAQGLADAAGLAPTELLPSPGVGADEATGLQETKAYTATATRATEVFERPQASSTIPQRFKVSSPKDSKPQPQPQPQAGELKRPLRAIRKKTAALAIAAVVVIAATVGAVAWSNSQTPEAPPATIYPEVPGTLGEHLKQLQESVTP